MIFSQEFIEKVEADPINGVVEACEITNQELEKAKKDEQSWNEAEHEILWEAASFLNALLEQEGFSVPYDFPHPSGDIGVNCKNTVAYVNGVRDHFKEQSILLKVQSYSSRYKTSLKSSFAYEFSKGDLDRIQTLVNELRDSIAEQSSLDPGHKQRLLRRLEKLQAELHKRVSDLDRFWGLIGDAGVVLGKLGKDAKPIVDRTKEIAEIVWNTQARAEELPSGAQNPMLEHESDS